ncbi:hypothetical protein EDB83DRAFT_426995 [Lactarius deliciosus]|nr:hypothetical protein EDB83DRAFT_426995 [Lactarius deliciosus]
MMHDGQCPRYLKTRARVRYVSSPQPEPVTTPSKFPTSGRVTIRELSDNFLLNIFRYYLDVSPQHWPRLVHICRRWRRIVFESQQTLHLRIFCTHGTPVLKTLPCWPAMPIVVEYGGSLAPDPPAPEDEENIMAALRQSDRVSSINLTVMNSLLEKLSAIETPFSELEDLVLLSLDGMPLTLPSAFRWGPRLRRLHSTRIAIPGLLQLLDSSTNLVDLQLHEAFDSWQFPPEALTNVLSGMAQLQSLSLHFSTNTADCHDLLSKSRGHAVLPVLTRLDFRGIFRYLECLVARIDAPRLGDIELTFSNKFVIGLPTLLKFIDRIEMHMSHRQAHILSSEYSITISLIQPDAPARLKLQLLCEPLSEQLLFLTRVYTHFNVEDLRISATRISGGRDCACGDTEWRDLLNLFTGVKWFHLDANLSTPIVRSLQLSDRRYKAMLPTLHTLYIAQPGPRHAPLREAVVSFMTSRRLSGHPIAVEYERPSHLDELRETGSLSQQMTIEMLSDVLLNVFHHYLDAAPRAWHTLTYVCRRWRQIMHTSPLGLNLRLYFTPGTPVLNALDCWLTLPIILQYGGVPNLDPQAPEDDDNIMAALKQSGRVNSIRLTVTNSLLGKLSAISEPFSELEELVILSQDNMQLSLPNTFRWGPRLRILHSTRIAFPSLPQLLSPSQNIVDIQLHEIPSAGYFSPEAFANALSGMTNLRILSLHFLSLPPRRNYLAVPPPPGERVVLPALTSIKYRGTSKYLDSLVARIDAPGLGDIDITLFSQPTMDASQLGRFIERTGIQTTLSQAEVQTSGHAISISFTSSGSSTPLRLQISCKRLDWQLSSMAQVCDQFSSPFLSGVNNLRITMTQSSSGQNDMNDEQWLELIRAFRGATDFRVADKLTTDILCALGLVDGGYTAFLPDLRHLHIENPMAMNESSWDGLLSFITLRSRSGHPIQVNVPFKQCHICHLASFGEKKVFDRHLFGHLVDKHGYRIMCSHCGDFEWKPGHDDLFRIHLKDEHFVVVHNDPRIWFHPLLTPDQLNNIVPQHSYLRAPDTVAPTAPHS